MASETGHRNNQNVRYIKFDHPLTVHSEHGQNRLRVNTNFEGLYPEECNSRCTLDGTTVDVTRSTGDDTAHSETNNNRNILEEW